VPLEEQQVPDVLVALAASREPVSQSQVEAPIASASGAPVWGASVSPALTSQAPESRPGVERAQRLPSRGQ
jgi:hypothetical protein